MLINEFTAVLTEAFEKKADKEMKAVSDKKIVAMPKFFRRILFAGFFFIVDFTVLGWIICSWHVFSILTAMIVTIAALFYAAYCLLAGTRIVYKDTEIEVTTFWIRKRHYNILDIKKVSCNLYFYHITFSDSFVVFNDRMTMAAEFYAFAKRNAEVIKGHL